MRLTFEWKCEVPLRDYQKEALDRIEEGFSMGSRRDKDGRVFQFFV